MAPVRDRLISLVSEHAAELRALGVSRLGLFGSCVRGEEQSDSDIDLLVEFESGEKSYRNFIQLNFLLEDRLHRRVELVTPEALTRHLSPHVLQEVEYVFAG